MTNKLSAIQSVVFYHYDDFRSGWTHTNQPRHGESVLFDRRDQGESAVAVLELQSKASFVSSNFVQKFRMKPQPVPAALQSSLYIGSTEVRPDSFVNLTFRCRGFGMPKQRQSFFVLESNDFEIMFGEDIQKRSQLARHATSASRADEDAGQLDGGNLKSKAQALIGRNRNENVKGEEQDGSVSGYVDGTFL